MAYIHVRSLGGKRVWPMKGFFRVGDESSLDVLQCSAPEDERCKGGPLSECFEGYTEVYCSECAEAYFVDIGNRCSPCQDPDSDRKEWNLKALLIVSIYTVVCLCVVFVSDPGSTVSRTRDGTCKRCINKLRIDHIARFIVTFQQIVIAIGRGCDM